MLLSDPQVVQFLKNDVVPAWQMIREVPKLQIDFGNGKKITRTLAGNTVMYLCTPDGKVLDAFPGVYTAADFLVEVKVSMASATAEAPALSWHLREGLAAPVPHGVMMATMGKAYIESPLLNVLKAPDPPRETSAVGKGGGGLGLLSASTTEQARAKLVFRRYAGMLRDLSKLPASPEAVLRSMGLPANATPDQIVAFDSRNNVRAVRPAVHLWMGTLDHLPSPQEAKEVLFKQVLHIPIDDPYLGLGSMLPGTGN